MASAVRRLLAVAPRAEQAQQALAEIGRGVTLVPLSADALPERLPEADAVWLHGELDDATIARFDGSVVVSGPGMGSVALGELIGRLRAEADGPLRRLAIRQPGGRRVRRAASKRTAFGSDGRVDWALSDADRARLESLAAPLLRVAETVRPGSAARLGITELIGGAAPRLTAHGLHDGVPVEVEVDEELRGDEAWEVEATCARATLLARFDQGRGVLLISAALRKTESKVDPRPADALLARHALAGPPRVGDRPTRARALDALRAMLDDAPRRLRERGLRVVLVHVPRYRNKHDELMLPSLGIARLAAYVRGYGFETRVADLEALHSTLDLSAFTDDARVDGWLAGEHDAELDARLDAMWPALEAELGAPCLVGFSIVDYFGHFQMNLASCLAKRVKDHAGHATVLGGERDQVDGDRGLREGMPFDHVVDGDGEHALYALACAVAHDDRDPALTPAVWTRRDDAIVRNRIVRSHLNGMPRPDFGGMPLDRYRRAPSRALMAALADDGLAPAEPPAPRFYLPYGFVKGCVADCTFCSAKEHLDVQAPEKTVDELLALRDRHGTGDFVFLNNLVNLGPKWLRKFCDRLIESKADLRWTDSCRPTGIDEALAARMAEAGCLLLNFGAESGSDSVLDRMKKGLRRADIFQTLRATHAAGILNRVNLIAGYFHETDEDVDQTISLVEELAESIDVIGCFQGFYLFPGMGVDPEAEGISIREGVDRLKTGQVTLMYDEIGGLKWEAKRARIDASRNRILAAIEAQGIRTIDKIDEYDLFYLARTFDDPAITARYVLRVPPPEASRINQAALLPGGATGRVA